MPTLKINNGNGIGFTSDTPSKMKVDFTGEGISVNNEIGTSGLFVEDMSGDDGGINTTVDNYTLTIDTSTVSPYAPIGDINRNVVQMIFTMCAYKVVGRSGSVVNIDNTQVKSVQDMLTEMNYPLTLGSWSSYNPNIGDLFQLVSNVVGRSAGSSATEDGNRYSGAGSVLALFAITGIQKVGYSIRSLTLTCLYSSLSQFSQGGTYSDSVSA